MDYNLQTNNRTKAGKDILPFLHVKSNTVKMKNPVTDQETEEEETISEEELLKKLNSAFRDMKLMMDGKKRKTPAEELLYELQNELQHNSYRRF